MKGFQGTIIADFFHAYEKFRDNPHQKCMAHLLNAITELMVKPEKENERMTLKIKKSEEVQAWETIGAEREPCKKIRGGKPKGGQLSAEQRAIMEQRFQLNQKTLRQAERLDSFVLSFFRSFVLSFFRSFVLSFFRQPFQDSVFDWRKPKAERLTRSAAEQQLEKLLESLRAEEIEDNELETLVIRCEKVRHECIIFLFRSYGNASRSIITEPSGISRELRNNVGFRAMLRVPLWGRISLLIYPFT